MTEPVLSRVLIANRGEIAVRVIRACRELGIAPVVVYGLGEERSLNVQLADDAYLLQSSGRLPYLDIDAIVAVALRAGCQAIHPGYGFLAENANFARACADAGLIFVGPSPESIQAMGDKITARSIAQAAGVPLVPGSDGPVADVAAAERWANENGYPIAVKATAGGGGRGFRVARSATELQDAFVGSAGEAERYFANPVVYLERYLDRPRHIEVQVFADHHGNCVWLGERDCSIQRRHQKLIEESPSPAVTPELRAALGQAAVDLARWVGYTGAGTVEFMVTPDSHFYFLEMNTRIQVEHTITEEVTGIDLVKTQLQVAAGMPLPFSQESVQPRGHAIQCRINAEDASRDFAPSPGVLTGFRLPEGLGIRVDSAMFEGAEILPSYDSLIAKLVTWGRDRDEAIARMRRALTEFRVEGLPTTIPFHQRVMDHPVFIEGGATTAFLPEHPEVIPPAGERVGNIDCAETTQPREMVVEVEGRRLTVRVHQDGPRPVNPFGSSPPRPGVSRQGMGSNHGSASGHEIRSPLQGTVVRVAVEPGATVAAGELVCVVEAMKMENEITAHRSGSIESVTVSAGSTVSVGTVVATIL